MKKQKIIIFSFLIAVVLFLSGCAGQPQDSKNNPIINLPVRDNSESTTPSQQQKVPKTETATDDIDKEINQIDAELDSFQNNELNENSLSDAEMGL